MKEMNGPEIAAWLDEQYPPHTFDISCQHLLTAIPEVGFLLEMALHAAPELDHWKAYSLLKEWKVEEISKLAFQAGLDPAPYIKKTMVAIELLLPLDDEKPRQNLLLPRYRQLWDQAIRAYEERQQRRQRRAPRASQEALQDLLDRLQALRGGK